MGQRMGLVVKYTYRIKGQHSSNNQFQISFKLSQLITYNFIHDQFFEKKKLGQFLKIFLKIKCSDTFKQIKN